MRRSVTFEANVLNDWWFGSIDDRNEVVDARIEKYPWHNSDKTAYDIEYQVLECKKNGRAKIKATFNYE